MYYEIQGEGAPLVLILGLGADISECGGIIHWFAEKFQVLAFDNRGVGRTDKPDITYSIDGIVTATCRVRQKARACIYIRSNCEELASALLRFVIRCAHLQKYISTTTFRISAANAGVVRFQLHRSIAFITRSIAYYERKER